MVLTKGSHFSFCSFYNTKLSFNVIPACTCFRRKLCVTGSSPKIKLHLAIGKHEEMELVPAVQWNQSRQQIQPGSLLNVYSPLLMLNITCQMNDPLTGLTKAAVILVFGRVIAEDYK